MQFWFMGFLNPNIITIITEKLTFSMISATGLQSVLVKELVARANVGLLFLMQQSLLKIFPENNRNNKKNIFEKTVKVK